MASPRTLRRQALAEATLRTAPQASVLREMLIQALQDRNVAIGAATGAARGLQGTIKNVTPAVKSAYGDALAQAGTIKATTDQALGGLGPAADPYRAARAREAEIGGGRLSASLAGALTDLSNERVQAAAGRAYATQAALGRYSQDKAKIERQAESLAGQGGLYASTRYGELTQAQQKQDFTARQNQLNRQATSRNQAANRQATSRNEAANRQNQRIIHGLDPKTGKPVAGAKPLTPAEQRARGKLFADAKDAIGQARVWIQRFKSGSQPLNDHEIRAKLLTGDTLTVTKDVPVIDPATKKAKVDARGQTVTRQQTTRMPVPKLDSDFVQAALDLEGQGYLSPNTVHALRGRRVHVPKQWLPVRVPSHYRRQPNSSGGGYGDVNLPAGARG